MNIILTTWTETRKWANDRGENFYRDELEIDATLQVEFFFKAVEGTQLADDLINFILDHNLEENHFYSLDAPNLFNVLRKDELSNEDKLIC